MKKDMELARRIRGDRNFDYVDRQPKTGEENFVSLPYETIKKAKWWVHLLFVKVYAASDLRDYRVCQTEFPLQSKWSLILHRQK